MTSYSRGDVVLVPFPISERLSIKKRPALVLAVTSREEEGSEVTIAQVTGHIEGARLAGDYAVVGWQEAGLLRPSVVRVRLATVPATAVVRKLGVLGEEEMRGVEAGVREVLGV